MRVIYHKNNWRWGRSKLGRKLDEKYKCHEIGWAHYNKISDKAKYWEWK